MASTVPTDRLREIAGFRADKGCAISLYLGFAPDSGAVVPDGVTKVNSLLDEAQKSAFASREDLSHDQKQGLQADFDRIRSFLTDDLDRSGVQGVAIFADGPDRFFSTNALSAPVDDEVRVGREFYVAPLVALQGRGEGAIVAVVDRERGLLFQLVNGRLETLADLSEEVPGRHDQGGWSQARYQRHIDELAREHLKTVAEELDGIVRAGDARHVVVIGPEEARARFDELLAPETKNAVVGLKSGEGYASANDFLALATPFLEQARLEEDGQLLARWQEESGRSGRAASGWTETLEAVSDGRVETLLFQTGGQRSAYVCPQCGRAQPDAGACPLDGAQMEEREDATDVAVHLALAHGGDARALPREAGTLDSVEGVAALLRF